MNFTQYTTKSAAETLRELGVAQTGLSEKETQERRSQYGLNKLPTEETSGWQIFLRQFHSSFIYLLLAAVTLSLILREMVDAVMILTFILINAGFGFYQEHRSEHTLKLLKHYLSPKARVRRENTERIIDSQDLVPGDIVILQPGDIVPADLRLLEEESLSIDESILTGESVPVKKITDKVAKPTREIYQARDIAFSGTTVTSGGATGVVLATGRKTAIGGIAKLTAKTARESTFEKELKELSILIVRLVLVITAFVFFTNLLLKGSEANPTEFAIFAIALAVSVVPEALPVVTTFSFSRGALRLAKNKVVVKRLSAIEDLGSIEVLCTDKTGTLTENKLTVDEVYPDKEGVLPLAFQEFTPLLGKIPPNNPFDAAIWQKLSPQERKKLLKWKKISEIPFDPNRRFQTTLLACGSRREIIARGAPETVIGLCRNITHQDKTLLEEWVVKKGREGRRILAIARYSGKREPNLLAEATTNFEFLGLVSFVDPIKKTAPKTIKDAEKLGVEIKILTGDSKGVAGAVAYQVGLITRPEDVITGEEFDKLPLGKQRETIERLRVFARVSPEQKYKIIQLLQEKREVGFLGEGINDAPALKIANVALAVQNATDIAREAADIILLKKSVGVIISGIKEGREIFANTTKYIVVTLASNFGNFLAVVTASFLINFLPMLPLQILLLNLLSDFPMIAIASDNVEPTELKRPKRYNLKEIVRLATGFGAVSSLFDFTTFAIFYQISPTVLQTNWFMESVLTELVLIASVRTRFFFLKAKRASTTLLLLIVLASAVTVLLPFTGLGQRWFNFHRPIPFHLLLILAIAVGYFATTEVVKLLYYKRRPSKGQLI